MSQKLSIRSLPAIAVGKLVRFVLRRILRGGGSALPGRIVETLDRGFLPRILNRLPYGVVLVTGTNGKTTTTHILAELLEGQGLRVFSNSTGSNFSRGIVSEMLGPISLLGKFPFDVAVLELDEAFGVHFAGQVSPKTAVFLNIMRDQLDRFGELDFTTDLLRKIASKVTGTAVLNCEDPNIMKLKDSLAPEVNVQYFALGPKMKQFFLNDEELYAASRNQANSGEQNPADFEKDAAVLAREHSSIYRRSQGETASRNVTTLSDYYNRLASIRLNGYSYSIEMALKGLHNIFNATAAISACSAVMQGEFDGSKMIKSLQSVRTAFGRGEDIEARGQKFELVLVKNPAGFRLALSSFEPDSRPVMIAINDDYADGRDVSWLYDVDFETLKLKSENSGAAVIAGTRAYDLGLKFAYTDNPAGVIEPDLPSALNQFCETPGESKRIYATYTAMLKIRALLLGKNTGGSGLD